VFVLVETEFDALLVIQAAGDLVGAVPLGSASSRPDKEAYPLLREAALLVNALDVDDAGAKNSAWWAGQFPRNHMRCPIPEGKDIGDYAAAGGDLRAWVLACLPPALRRVLAEAPSAVPAKPALSTESANMSSESGQKTAESVEPVNDSADSLNKTPQAAAPQPLAAASAAAPTRRPRSIAEAEERMRRELGEGPLRDQTLELSLLLRSSPELHAVATPEGGMALRYPPGWDRRNEDRFRRASRLFFGDAGLAYIQYVELPVRPDGWKPGK
jgi:hypothetical protein